MFVTPKFCIRIVFSFSWGHSKRETEDNAYAKFWGDEQKEHYGMLCYFLEWSIDAWFI